MATATKIAKGILDIVKEKAGVTGDVSDYSLVNILIGATSYTLETVYKDFVNFEKSVENTANTQRVGSLHWYQNIALNYRSGVNLVTSVAQYEEENDDVDKGKLPNYIPTYHPNDDNKGTKKVKFARVRETGVNSLIKISVAKDFGKELTTSELDDFREYIKQVKILGDLVEVSNSAIYPIQVELTIVHSVGADDIKNKTLSAVKNFFNSQYLLSYFSDLSLSSYLVDNVAGIKNVYDIKVFDQSTTPNKIEPINGVYSPGASFFSIVDKSDDSNIKLTLHLKPE